ITPWHSASRTRSTRQDHSYVCLHYNEVFGGLRNTREFMSVLCQPGNTLHFRFVQDQQHEYVIGDLPFALDSMFAGGPESESRIVVGVSYNNNKWAACVLKFPIARLDQFTSNS